MLDAENSDDKIDFRRIEIRTILKKCNEYVSFMPEIAKIAAQIQANSNTKQKDSIHLACAVYKKCQYFVTCDNDFIKTIMNNAERLMGIIGNVKVVNPIEFCEKEVLGNNN